MRRLGLVLAILTICLQAGSAAAHEVRPAYLQIDETASGQVTVLWKQPTMGEYAIHLQPHLSNGWLEKPPADQFAAGGYLVKTWKIGRAPEAALAGVRVDIDGLRDTMTDVILRVHSRAGQDFNCILRPEAPEAVIPAHASTQVSSAAFLLLGLQHILRGPDHLLFVLGLLLIAPSRGALMKTITAFTVAHSITLAVATLGHMALSTTLLNALVALSILFLALEVARADNGGDSLTLRQPWLVAFAFGLLHGFGFATGLVSLELDKAHLAGALLLFNLGVEIGQLAFVALVLSLVRGFELMEIRWQPAAKRIPAYAIGSLGAFWTIQNITQLFAGAA